MGEKKWLLPGCKSLLSHFGAFAQHYFASRRASCFTITQWDAMDTQWDIVKIVATLFLCQCGNEAPSEPFADLPDTDLPDTGLSEQEERLLVEMLVMESDGMRCAVAKIGCLRLRENNNHDEKRPFSTFHDVGAR
jgi:hypothetical protein